MFGDGRRSQAEQFDDLAHAEFFGAEGHQGPQAVFIGQGLEHRHEVAHERFLCRMSFRHITK